MGGPRAKDEDERRERRRAAKKKCYLRSVARKKQAALAVNQLELQKSQAILEACAAIKSVSRDATDKEPLDNYFPLLGSSRESPQPSSSSLDFEDEVDTGYQPSDDDPSETTMASPEGEAEAEKRLLLSDTWECNVVEGGEEVFVKRLCKYYDEIDGFLRMDAVFLKHLLETKEAELPDAWAAVKMRELVAYQVALLEQLLQRIGLKEWDEMITFMVNACTVRYHRSRTLAYIHQRQVEFLKTGLGSGELEHHLCAFKNWWLAALPGRRVDRV